MRKNLNCLLLSLLLILSAFALSASADPYYWKTPWRSGTMYVTQLATASHEKTGNNAAFDFAPSTALSGLSYPLYAPWDIARVVKSEYDISGYGYMVRLELTDGYTIIFAHLDGPSPLVAGQTNLGSDTYIGLMGSSGRDWYKKHLHLELFVPYTSKILLFGQDTSTWMLYTTIPANDSPPSGGNPNPEPDPNPITNASVSLHDDNNGGGKTVKISQIPVVLSDISSLFEANRIGSITIHEDGVSVKVYANKGFDGHNMTYSGKGVHNLPGDLDNNVESIKIYSGDEPSNPGSGGDVNLPQNLVTFCNASSGMTSGKGPREWNVPVGVGEVSRASDMPFPNDQLSGVYITVDGLVVELFTDDGFSGQSIVLDKKGFYSLAQGSGLDFDDRTSSYKVYFKDQKIVSNPPTSPTNPVTDEYDVSSVSVDPAGNLVMTIRNENTGAIISPTWTRADEENSFLVKVPDNCTFYIDPAYDVIALDTDPSFASGSGGELFANGQYTGIKYFPGSTVRFGPHTALTSFTIWIEPSSDYTDPDANPPVVNLPVIPNPDRPEDNDDEDDSQSSGENPTSPDDDYTSKHKVDVSLDGGGGGGCSTGSSEALLGIVFTVIAASVKKRRCR